MKRYRNVELHSRIRQRRRELALTQVQLGDLARLSPKTISRLELGLAEPHPTTLARLAQALQCAPVELLSVAQRRL